MQDQQQQVLANSDTIALSQSIVPSKDVTSLPLPTLMSSKRRIKLRDDYIPPIRKIEPLSVQFPMKKPPNVLKDYNLMSCVEKGDVIVRHVCDLLLSLDIVSDLLNTSCISNNLFDIVVRTK